jgi:Arc/MetJ-type ribon-helix-helix transcriptional regulator
VEKKIRFNLDLQADDKLLLVGLARVERSTMSDVIRRAIRVYAREIAEEIQSRNDAIDAVQAEAESSVARALEMDAEVEPEMA